MLAPPHTSLDPADAAGASSNPSPKPSQAAVQLPKERQQSDVVVLLPSPRPLGRHRRADVGFGVLLAFEIVCNSSAVQRVARRGLVFAPIEGDQ